MRPEDPSANSTEISTLVNRAETLQVPMLKKSRPMNKQTRVAILVTRIALWVFLIVVGYVVFASLTRPGGP